MFWTHPIKVDHSICVPSILKQQIVSSNLNVSKRHGFNNKDSITGISKIVFVVFHHKVCPAEYLDDIVIRSAKIVLNEENAVFYSWVWFKKETVVKVAKSKVKRAWVVNVVAKFCVVKFVPYERCVIMKDYISSFCEVRKIAKLTYEESSSYEVIFNAQVLSINGD